MSSRPVVMPDGLLSQGAPRKTHANAYTIPRVAPLPATASHENFKQLFEGFLTLNVPQVVCNGTSGVECMVACERAELTQAELRAVGSPDSKTTGAHSLHPLPRRVSVHLILPSVDGGDNRAALDALTAVAVCGSGKSPTRPINTMRFTVSAGLEATMVRKYYESSGRAFNRTSQDVLLDEANACPIIMLVWSTVSHTSTNRSVVEFSLACSLLCTLQSTDISALANMMRQCLTCLAVECNVPIPVGLVCPPIKHHLDIDFYRMTYVEVSNRFADLCNLPVEQAKGPLVEGATLGSTALYMRMTHRRAAEQDARNHSVAYGKQCTPDDVLCKMKCSAHFVPAIMMCIEGKQEEAIDFCLHPRHARTGLPEPSIKQDVLGLVLVAVEHESKDISDQISLYGWRGIPGCPIFPDSDQSKIGIIRQKKMTYTAELHANWCVQPCGVNDLLPTKKDLFVDSARKCLAIINSLASGTDGGPLSPFSPCLHRRPSFNEGVDTASMAEEYCISEWGTHEHTNMASVAHEEEEEPTASNSGLCALLGISSMSDKTSVGDVIALSYEMNGQGDVARGLLLSFAATYGIGTSIKKCMQNMSELLGRPSQMPVDRPINRKRSVSVAIGSLDVAMQSQKRRSPDLFCEKNTLSTCKAIRMSDILRALNVACVSDQTEDIPRRCTENDGRRRESYLRAVGWGFHSLGMKELTRLDHARSDKNGDGVERISVSMSLQIAKLEELSKKLDLVAEALQKAEDLPADPALAIALVYRMCLDVGVDLTTAPKFIIFAGDDRVRSYHRLTKDATLEDATLEDLMMLPNRRLLIASSLDEERAHVREIAIPVPRKA